MNPQMVKKIQKMQREMEQAQRDLEEMVFEGIASGVVTVEVKGSKEVLRVKINKDSIDSLDDLDMIEDIIVAAINDAMRKIDAKTQEVMGRFTAGLPGGFGF